MISEIITIDDDDDPISEMKINLQESFLKYKKSVEVVDLSPNYSPTQSPSLILSPNYRSEPPVFPASQLFSHSNVDSSNMMIFVFTTYVIVIVFNSYY